MIITRVAIFLSLRMFLSLFHSNPGPRHHPWFPRPPQGRRWWSAFRCCLLRWWHDSDGRTHRDHLLWTQVLPSSQGQKLPHPMILTKETPSQFWFRTTFNTMLFEIFFDLKITWCSMEIVICNLISIFSKFKKQFAKIQKINTKCQT